MRRGRHFPRRALGCGHFHGEKEAEAREKSLKEGVFIDDATCALLDSLAKEADVRLPPNVRVS